MKHAVEAPEEEAVHKLRVAIRRFQQAMRLFRAVLETGGVDESKAGCTRSCRSRGNCETGISRSALTKDQGANTIVLADQRAELDQQFTSLIRPLTYTG